MTADDSQLIDDQYADRPQLRAILDAVLAALPALGPVTVQPRKTVVSLVTPRRTFALVQATTRTRVDLGLRLDGAEPHGRLLPARDIGAATLRIELSSPEDFDDEAAGWLRLAYEQNTAPAPPRQRPGPRPARDPWPLIVVIEGHDLPGRSCRPDPNGQVHDNVHVAGPSHPGQAAELVPGDAPSARWQAEVKIRRGPDGIDFGGPFVHGDRADRNLGLAWGDVQRDGAFLMFRRAKLRLVDVDPSLVEEALRPGHRLVARICLTDARGNPICARVRSPYIAWSVERTQPPDGNKDECYPLSSLDTAHRTAAAASSSNSPATARDGAGQGGSLRVRTGFPLDARRTRVTNWYRRLPSAAQRQASRGEHKPHSRLHP